MPSDVTQLALVMGAATLTNTVYNVQKSKDPVPSLVASGIMFGGLSVVGQLSGKWELATAFAWVFLIATMIGRGIPMFQSLTKLAAAPPSTTSPQGGSTGNGSSGAGGGGGGGGGI